jgi:hypothetical protein
VEDPDGELVEYEYLLAERRRWRAAVDNLCREATNLLAHETGDAKFRGRTAEGRTVTALHYALIDAVKALEEL